ncbi:hypothetical protein PFLG_01232, partial [Plasmodium falciparum RAJ116]
IYLYIFIYIYSRIYLFFFLVLKRKLENKDEFKYYIVRTLQRKKVKNALIGLSEDYNIDVLNFLLKLFKKINNDYYNNILNFQHSNYYNYFVREDTKFVSFSEQINIILNIYNFVRMKYILENICLHLYFEVHDDTKENYEYTEKKNGSNKKMSTVKVVKERSNSLLHFKKKNISNTLRDRKNMIYLIKNRFKKIESFCKNNLHCNVFENFKICNMMCLYILKNNYKMKCILYNIFSVMFFINNYFNIYNKGQITNHIKKLFFNEDKSQIKNEFLTNPIMKKLNIPHVYKIFNKSYLFYFLLSS